MKVDKMAIVFILIAMTTLSGCANDLQIEYPNPSDPSAPTTDDVPIPSSLVPIVDDVPESIVTSANNIVISKVGKENFGRYYTFEGGTYRQGETSYDLTQHFFAKPHYSLYYAVNDFRFTLFIDENGGRSPAPLPVPDCVARPSECVFIDKSEAVDIAQQNLLEKGVEPWDVTFEWDVRKSTHVWRVISFLTGGIRGQGQCSDEKIMSIDANSGEVVDIQKGGVCA